MLKTQLETDVTEYYRGVYNSIIQLEFDVLDEVLDDGFTLKKLSGDVSSKEEFFDELRDGSLVFYSENVERVYVKKDGDLLNVRGRSKVNISVDGSKRRIKKIQVDIVLKKTEEGKDPDTGKLDPSLTRWRVMSAEADIY